MEGIPRRGIAYVVPAAPGTLSCDSPITGPLLFLGAPGKCIPLPATNFTFSSSVIALTTAEIGSLPNCGAGDVWARVMAGNKSRREMDRSQEVVFFITAALNCNWVRPGYDQK